MILCVSRLFRSWGRSSVIKFDGVEGSKVQELKESVLQIASCAFRVIVNS